MSDYEDLVERCHGLAYQATYEDIRIIIAEVLRTLETVTPDMAHAAGVMTDGEYATAYLDMLHASPLSPPKQESPQ